MTENCIDAGQIQAFLDGELQSAAAEKVARHVAACDECAASLAVAEEESALAFSALEQEFNNPLVPTQRLWTKINDSIEQEKKSFWKPIFAFLRQPATAVLASLLFVAAIVIALLSSKPDAPTNYVAQNQSTKQIIAPVEKQTEKSLAANQPIEAAPEKPEIVSDNPRKSEFVAEKISYTKKESAPRIVNQPIQPNQKISIVNPPSSANLADEDSYLKTIATLEKTVGNSKDAVLNSSARFAFEKDLAIADGAIEQMKQEIRKNPKNEAAKQILRASYQNKIDLLTSVTEKNELMANVK